MPAQIKRRKAPKSRPNKILPISYYIIVAAYALIYPIVFMGGGFLEAFEEYSRSSFIAVLSLLLLFVAGIFARLTTNRKEGGALNDLSLGALFILASYTLITLEDTVSNNLYPLIYFIIALIAAFYKPWLTAILVAYTVVLELFIYFTLPKSVISGFGTGTHISFILLFALLFSVFTRFEILREKLKGEKTVTNKLEQIEQEALDYRLISLMSIGGADLSEEEKRMKRQLSSVNALKSTLYDTLSVLKESLSPHTCALYMLDPSGEILKLKECASDSAELMLDEISAAEGFVGSIIKYMQPIVVENIKSSKSGVTYYSQEPKIRSFIGLPLLEQNYSSPLTEQNFIRGALFCDSEKKSAFNEGNFSLLDAASRQILGAIAVEQRLASLDSDRSKKNKFYEASFNLNQALTLDDVYKALFETAREILHTDFMAVTIVLDGELGQNGIMAVDGDDRGILEGKRFKTGQSLVSSVIKNGVALPHSPYDKMEERKRTVFYEGEILPALKSVKVIPLVVKNKLNGAFVIGGKKRNAFDHDELDMISVIANQGAISISNARMYQKMELMAITDGLTNLFNHRTFQEKFTEAVSRSDRSNDPLSFLLIDIDHFKKVNDTYGHPMGDEVLRRVSKKLQSVARDIDIVARYGGEEFAIIMEMTNAVGAMKIAERIRKEVKKLIFTAPQGKFSITLSLGIAEYPKDGGEKQKIIDLADEALYWAKEHGRNQAVHLPSLKEK